jgi:hemoglobin-like flavoprotein
MIATISGYFRCRTAGREIPVMTPEQIDLIRRSFDRIWPIRRKLAGLFYSRFFELVPDAHRLFPADLERQHLKLLDMIAAIVGALDQRELFQSLISHSGRQHVQFGVKPLLAFGDALIWSLEQQFGPAFTPDHLKQAWIALYNAVQGTNPSYSLGAYVKDGRWRNVRA